QTFASWWLLEGMGTVCPDREEELEQQLVGGLAFGVARAAKLTPNLAKLTRPVSEDEGAATVMLRRIPCPLGPIVSAAQKPSSAQLVFSRAKEAKGALGVGYFFSTAPEEFRPRGKRVVDRPSQWFPAEGVISALEVW